ncbi:GNAT family N-acetyltransferase [Undibacterium sp.]|jgi:ribosomal protein S18 acetylase RimI-like enzyme|uniref:GNAT family N-acetyltransferase n=1 Tax=Undibacterium sp. TaxID=1914977 RepID=UPI002C9C89A7|nr:GNAT family N-acetyltransferase [Undibacterium sp.]HTD05951.1 GNAT family N-acetyltransferase [Undibacterium sp.]
MEMIVRKATAEDAQLIAHLTRLCWADKVAASSSGHHESSDRVAGDLKLGGGFVLLANRETAGSVRWLPLETASNIWEMLRMGVLPCFRGGALSRHLLEAVIHSAQAAGVAELRLGVRSDQPRLLDFYASHGFELAPELEYSHANPNEPAPNVMRRFLKR